MLDTRRMTLSQFLGLEENQPARATKLASSESFKEVKERIARSAPGFNLPEGFYEKVFEAMLKKLDAVLNIDIPDLLAKAWSKRKELLEYVDREVYPPDTAFTVFFRNHDFSSTHHPVLNPIVSEKIKLEQIIFDVDLELNVKGVVLEIQDAKIKKANFGLCKGTGTIGYKGVSFLEKENELLELGSVDWGEGVAIAAPKQVSMFSR
ncbi:MAG: hypothetical protein AAFY26_18155 [Cyanobacteria bacterium J06638_22]